ncbi:MAG TPA: autotransporter domain-containing protein [Chthoniobacteraceae bacterium]|jgi:autotransporter-associated beta strand protein
MKTPAFSLVHPQAVSPRPLQRLRKGRARKSEARRAAALFFATLLATTCSGWTQAIDLGVAENFTILGGTTVTNTGPTVISGNVGVSPGTAITGFPPGVVTGGTLHFNDALAAQAQFDAAAAFGQLAGETVDFDLSGQNLGGLTLTPGVYNFASDAELTGTLSLDTLGNPDAVFHFQIGTSLTTATASQILLLGLNGGAASNIFWQVGSSATLGLGSDFDGTLIAFTSITLTTGATLDGRALALNGAVTLDSNAVSGALGAIALGTVWNGGASNLWSGVNWSPDVTGATTSTLAPDANVVFSVTGIAPQNQNTILDFAAIIASLTVNDPAAVTISGPNTLTINGNGVNAGVTINNGAGLTTINTNLALAGQSQVMTVNNAAGLVIDGVVSGTIGLTKAGTGPLTLGGANTYTGATAVLQGSLVASAANVVPATSGVIINGNTVFDLNGNAQSVGSLSDGPNGGGSILLDTAPLIIGNDNSSTLFSGVISGPGALQKVGSGTQILAGANTYVGPTSIAAGILQAGATNVIPKNSAVTVGAAGQFNLDGFNQSIGSLAGAGGVDLAAASLVTGNDGRSAVYSGVISGPGSVQKVGAGTWELTGANSYTGLTTLSAGTLAVNGSIAGNALVSGGTLRGFGTIGGNLVNAAAVNPGRVSSPGTLKVVGRFTQVSSGDLNIRLASPTTYDRMAIGGSAKLGGGLNVTYLNGFDAEVGDTFTILSAAGGVSGTFASFDDEHATGTLLTLQVSYRPRAVVLEFAQGSFVDLDAVFELTPNELSVAKALDDLADEQPDSKLIQELNTYQLADIPEALSLLSGEDYGAIFTTGLAISQVQLVNIERRLGEVRQGSGFSDSGFAVMDSHGAQNYDGKSVASADGKGVRSMEGKESKDLVESAAERERRWGFFITGTGAWGDVETTSSARGSSFTTGGVTIGADYRVNRHLVVGAAVGYVNTSADLSRGGSLEVDGGKASLYATVYDGGFYVNGIVGAGYGSVETRRRTLGGFAHGDTDATDFSALLGTGYDVHVGGFAFGPVASIQYGTVGIDSFTEHGAPGALRVDAQSQDSLKSALGLKASYTKKVGRVVLRPEIRAQWQHEFLDHQSSIDAGFSSRNSFTSRGPETGRDGLLVDAGISAQLTSGLSIFAFYAGELGRENFTVHSVTGGLSLSF